MTSALQFVVTTSALASVRPQLVLAAYGGDGLPGLVVAAGQVPVCEPERGKPVWDPSLETLRQAERSDSGCWFQDEHRPDHGPWT